MANQCPNYTNLRNAFLYNNSIIVSNDTKRTEKDLHISSFRLNFATKCKKTAHKCCNFQKKCLNLRRRLETLDNIEESD